MRSVSPLLFLALIGAGLASGDNLKAGRPVPVFSGRSVVSAASIDTITASPGTISFTASNPTGSAAGSSPATVSWTISSGNNANDWTLTAQASSSTFGGCSTVPVSAVTATCTSASVSGGSGTGSCNGGFTLSTSPAQIAAGKQGANSQTYSVSINFSLSDSWRYVATQTPCTLTITYLVNAP